VQHSYYVAHQRHINILMCRVSSTVRYSDTLLYQHTQTQYTPDFTPAAITQLYACTCIQVKLQFPTS